MKMKKRDVLWTSLVVLGLVWFPMKLAVAQGQMYGGIKQDTDLIKSMPWRAYVPWLPVFSLRYGVGYTPAYFAPANADASPYVSGGLGVGMAWALGQAGVRGYWSDLGISLGWGLSHMISDNAGGGQFARQTYARDLGISIGKTLFVEKNTGISLGFGIGFKVPLSLASIQSTLITSIAPGLSLSKTFFNRVSLSYSFGMNFNFYQQDSGLYNPDLAGIPGLNQRWGMSHSLGVGVQIVRGLSISAAVNIAVGYSFADAYATTDGPQVFGGENLSLADRASYAINEGNAYGVSLSISYRFNQYLGISASYSNGGPQFEFQYDNEGNRRWILRNPFKLQDSSFAFGISGRI